jgi:hypothetical protein
MSGRTLRKFDDAVSLPRRKHSASPGVGLTVDSSQQWIILEFSVVAVAFRRDCRGIDSFPYAVKFQIYFPE